MHESTARDMNQQTMTQLAEQTGGRVCINNNDLADCVKKAVDDGSTYYELAYYPDAASWTGEFHRVTVKTTRPGMRLSFREGYYARPEGGSEPGQYDNKKVQTKLQEAACHDLLTSTSLLVMAESVPPDVAGQVKYFIAIDPSRLNFAPTGNGHRLSLIVAACAFDKSGTPVQSLQQPTEAELSDQQQRACRANRGFTRTWGFPPAANAVKVRLLVRDNQNGLRGSVDLPFAPPPA